MSRLKKKSDRRVGSSRVKSSRRSKVRRKGEGRSAKVLSSSKDDSKPQVISDAWLVQHLQMFSGARAASDGSRLNGVRR